MVPAVHVYMFMFLLIQPNIANLFLTLPIKYSTCAFHVSDAYASRMTPGYLFLEARFCAFPTIATEKEVESASLGPVPSNIHSILPLCINKLLSMNQLFTSANSFVMLSAIT